MFTSEKYLLRQMNLVWGVTGFYYDETNGIDDTFEELRDRLVAEGYLEKGDVFINTSSMPLHWEGHTNMMRVDQVV